MENGKRENSLIMKQWSGDVPASLLWTQVGLRPLHAKIAGSSHQLTVQLPQQVLTLTFKLTVNV